MRIPDFFLVGAPKCGTSAMYEALRQHPEVFMPPRKEPHYFGFDHTRINYSGMSEDTYRGLFQDVGAQKRVGDASTSYLHSSTAATEIKKFSPSARILIMLRNPVDVMHAYHESSLRAGFEFIADFEEALAAEPDRKAGRQWPRYGKGILQTLFYREIVSYPDQIARYWQVFGRERVEIVIHDDYRQDPIASYARVYAFLDIDCSYVPSVGEVNVSRQLRSLRLQHFLRHPPAFVQRVSHVIAPERVRQQLVSALGELNVRHARRPPLGAELRRQLQAECLPSVERLSAMLGRDLTGWCR